MSAGAAAPYQEYVGRTESRDDVVASQLLERLAATLEVPLPVDGSLPPLWHWLLFQQWAPASGLGPDGHAMRGGFLPPVHELPRRMWGGGRVVFHGPLLAGEAVTRTSTILSVEARTGSSGRLVFVCVGHEVTGPRGLAIAEEQDIIYRDATGVAVKRAEPAAAARDHAFTRRVLPDPVLLFRYSALTGNGHRIHYDRPYAEQEEGYPGLVVHGPLQATWLADLLSRQDPGARLARFSYRGLRAAIAGRPLTLEGWRDGALVRLRTRDTDGAACMSAEATLA